MSAPQVPPIPIPIDIVVFDLGGVVVRICRSIAEAAARVNLPVDPVLAQPEYIAQRRALHRDYERGLLTCDQFFERIAATTRGMYTPAQFRAIHEAWIIEEYAGVGDLIDDLHRADMPTGALSNTNAAHWAQMSSTDKRTAIFGAPARLRHRHASHLLGLAKPDAAIYHAFAQHTGFAPNRIVFFDDLADNIQAAQAAGWNAHQIDHAGDTAQQMRTILCKVHGVSL